MDRQAACKQANGIEDWKIENVLGLGARNTFADIKNIGDHKNREDRNFRSDQRNDANGPARRQNPFRLRWRLRNHNASQLASPVSFIFPIRIFGMLQIPERPATFNHGNRGKIVIRRWRRCGPFERPGVPRIISGWRALEHRPQKISDEYEYRGGLKEHTDGDDQIPRIPSPSRLVGVNSARHSQYARDMHEIKCQVKTNQEQPEMPFRERLVVHPPAHFWEPIVEGSKNGEQNSSDDHVVKMR